MSNTSTSAANSDSILLLLITKLFELLSNPPDGIPKIVLYIIWSIVIVIVAIAIYKIATRNNKPPNSSASHKKQLKSKKGKKKYNVR